MLKLEPMPFGPAITKPEGVSVTVAVPVLYPPANALIVAEPDAAELCANVEKEVAPAGTVTRIDWAPAALWRPNNTAGLSLETLTEVELGETSDRVTVIGICRF